MYVLYCIEIIVFTHMRKYLVLQTNKNLNTAKYIQAMYVFKKNKRQFLFDVFMLV